MYGEYDKIVIKYKVHAVKDYEYSFRNSRCFRYSLRRPWAYLEKGMLKSHTQHTFIMHTDKYRNHHTHICPHI